MLNKNTIFAVLLVFLPISIAGHYLEWGETLVFITAALTIVPLAAFMGLAT
jgi:Ca2+:H+ antiporter